MEIILALAIGVLVGSGVWLMLRPRSYQVDSASALSADGASAWARVF